MKNISDVIITTVEQWWDRWHRFAEEDDEAPENIKILIAKIETDCDLTFDIMRGVWKDIK